MIRASTSMAAVALACAAALARAQQNSVVGVVRDSAGVPIPQAEIATAARGPGTRTDSLGRFYLAYPRADSVTLVVRRMGYERVTFTVSSAAAAENSIEITMAAVARALPGVTVDETSLRARTVMEGFDYRRARGSGVYLTKADIATRNTQELSNVLRGQRGVVITRGRTGRPTLRFSQWLSKNCAPQYWVDGRRVLAFEIDDIPAGDVEGIELYDGPATTPGEFMRGPEFACGTVVIWTRVPMLNVP